MSAATVSAANFGPPPAADFELVPSAEEIALFQQNGFLVVERLTTDAEIAWLREIFEFIFDGPAPAPANAPKVETPKPAPPASGSTR